MVIHGVCEWMQYCHTKYCDAVLFCSGYSRFILKNMCCIYYLLFLRYSDAVTEIITPVFFLAEVTYSLLCLSPRCPSSVSGMLPVHPASVAARNRPSAGRGGEGKGGGRRAGGLAVATAAPLAAAQQLAAPPDGGQGRAVRGGGRGEEGQRRGVHRRQLLLPHHRRIHRRQGNGGGGEGQSSWI